jgi:hypothetical protein
MLDNVPLLTASSFMRSESQAPTVSAGAKIPIMPVEKVATP